MLHKRSSLSSTKRWPMPRSWTSTAANWLVEEVGHLQCPEEQEQPSLLAFWFKSAYVRELRRSPISICQWYVSPLPVLFPTGQCNNTHSSMVRDRVKSKIDLQVYRVAAAIPFLNHKLRIWWVYLRKFRRILTGQMPKFCLPANSTVFDRTVQQHAQPTW